MDKRTSTITITIGALTVLSLIGFAWWSNNRANILASCIKRLDRGLSSGSVLDIPGVYLDWKGDKCEEAREIAR
jgi:hypothetical protein